MSKVKLFICLAVILFALSGILIGESRADIVQPWSNTFLSINYYNIGQSFTAESDCGGYENIYAWVLVDPPTGSGDVGMTLKLNNTVLATGTSSVAADGMVTLDVSGVNFINGTSYSLYLSSSSRFANVYWEGNSTMGDVYTGGELITSLGYVEAPPFGEHRPLSEYDIAFTVASATQPIISRSPTSLSNSCFEGSDASDQSFDVWNSGGGTLSYSISDNAAWLSCTPTGGTSTGEQDTITVTYATSSLLSGSYSATITISDPSASNSPQTIPVTLTVTALSPDIAISPSSFQTFDFGGPFDSPGSIPRDLAFDGTYLWNADSSADKIYKLDTSGNIIDSFDSPGSGPSGLTFDGTYLWNADSTTDRIYKLDISGNIIESFDSPGTYPEGLAFDGTYLWNADADADKIYKLDISGNIIGSFDSPGSIPRGLTFDGTYLWNADSITDRIYKLDISGNIIDSSASPGPYPMGLAFDGTYLWNADYSSNKIYKLDTSGSAVDYLDSPGPYPSGLAFDGTYFWNADYSDDKIYKLDTSGNIIDSFDSPGPGPSGLAFDGTYLWNADPQDGKIYKLDTSGSAVDYLDSPGQVPRGLTFDGTYLWHADLTDDKIYKLDTLGNIIAFFDSPGPSPVGLSFDGTYLWNADDTDDKVYKLDTSGNIIDSFDSPGPWPDGLAFDGTYLWCTDKTDDIISKLLNVPGPAEVGSSKTRSFTVTNAGDSDLEIGTLGITGTDALEFAIENDFCSGQTIGVSGNCSVDVVFSPISTGEKTANLEIPSNDPDTPILVVTLDSKALDNLKVDFDEDGDVDGSDLAEFAANFDAGLMAAFAAEFGR